MKRGKSRKAAKTTRRKKNRTVIKKAQRVVVLNKAKRAKKNPKNSKGKAALKRTGRALKGAARSLLGAGSELLGAGAIALNPAKRQAAKKAGKRQAAKKSAKKAAKRRNAKSVAAKPRRRNKAPHISEADIAKLSPQAQAQLRAQLQKVEEREVKATTPAQKKAAAKSRRSWLARLGTQLKVIGSTKKYKVSARDLGRCKRKTVKVRSRHETDALAKAQSKLGAGFDQFKVGNPRKPAKKAKKRVTARSPRKSGRSRRPNPSPEETRKSFAGSVSGHRDLYFPQGTPHGLAKIGKLVSITTEEGVIKPVHGTAWLCADTAGKLHIGSVSPSPLFDGPKRSFGKVSKVEYEDVKKHLGYTKPTIFFHHVGEENGIKPTLHADGKGGLVFKGGAYRLTSRGLEN